MPEDGWQPGRSSAVEWFRYRPDRGVLQLVYVDGGMVYDYPCPPALFERFLRAPSKGRFVNAELKPHAEAQGWSPRPRHWTRSPR